jgi:hypothetical protein
MPGPHDKIIADAAKSVLGPLNFNRKGRSRIWVADRGWWLAVVEFQPSAWSKGSSLNVAAHWLWTETGFISFDFVGRGQEFVEYLSDAQFVTAAFRLAEGAAHEAQRLLYMFSSLDATARVLRDESPGDPRWAAYHAGIVAGLLGDADEAKKMFSRVLDIPAPPGLMLHSTAALMGGLATKPLDFRREAVALIERQRNALRLPPLDASPF